MKLARTLKISDRKRIKANALAVLRFRRRCKPILWRFPSSTLMSLNTIECIVLLLAPRYRITYLIGSIIANNPSSDSQAGGIPRWAGFRSSMVLSIKNRLPVPMGFLPTKTNGAGGGKPVSIMTEGVSKEFHRRFKEAARDPVPLVLVD